MTSKVLFVDDETKVLEGYQRNLRKRYAIETASSGEQGLGAMSDRGPFAVVVADMQMPGMDGVEFLRRAQQLAPDSVRLMLTGNADQKTAVEAVNQGHVYQFLNKPCPPDMLVTALDNAVQQYRLITAEKELLEKTLNGCINMLTGILVSAEEHAFGRGEQLRDYMRAFTRSFNLGNTWELELAAMLSQIGFVTVPPKLLEKRRLGKPLTPVEEALLTRIPEIGAHLLRNIPRLEPVANIILYQNKGYDGSGFPENMVVGEEIPIGGRILKVLTDLVELEATGLTKPKALEQMQSRSAVYDPHVLDSTFACFDIYLKAPTAVALPPKPLMLKEVAIGHVLSSNVETKDGVLIICAGTRVTQMVLEKLRNFEQVLGVKEPILIRAEESGA